MRRHGNSPPWSFRSSRVGDFRRYSRKMTEAEPPEQPQPPMRASHGDRERVARLLHAALAEGRITVQELEERLDTVYQAKTLAELEPPIADLPTDSPGTLETVASRVTAPDHRIGGTPGSAASVAVMSGAS